MTDAETRGAARAATHGDQDAAKALLRGYLRSARGHAIVWRFDDWFSEGQRRPLEEVEPPLPGALPLVVALDGTREHGGYLVRPREPWWGLAVGDLKDLQALLRAGHEAGISRTPGGNWLRLPTLLDLETLELTNMSSDSLPDPFESVFEFVASEWEPCALCKSSGIIVYAEWMCESDGRCLECRSFGRLKKGEPKPERITRR